MSRNNQALRAQSESLKYSPSPVPGDETRIEVKSEENNMAASRASLLVLLLAMFGAKGKA